MVHFNIIFLFKLTCFRWSRSFRFTSTFLYAWNKLSMLRSFQRSRPRLRHFNIS